MTALGIGIWLAGAVCVACVVREEVRAWRIWRRDMDRERLEGERHRWKRRVQESATRRRRG